jgi:predicted dehydrogenase
MLQLLVGRLDLQHAEAKTMIPHRSVVPGQPPVDVDVDDWALLHVTNPAGVPGVVETSRIALGAECCRIELYGTNGSIVCDLHHELEPRVQTFGPAPAVAEPPSLQYLPPARLSLGAFIDAHQASLYHFLLRCAGTDPTPGWAPRFADSLEAERLVYEALAR